MDFYLGQTNFIYEKRRYFRKLDWELAEREEAKEALARASRVPRN